MVLVLCKQLCFSLILNVKDGQDKYRVLWYKDIPY